jgi:hypothetical protein
VKGLETYCNVCPDRPVCTGLCETARKYADQDKVNLKEKLVANHLEYGEFPWGSNITGQQKRFSLREKAVIALTVCKFTNQEICTILKINKGSLSDCRTRINVKKR